ncbi:hypothetical protein ACJKIH_03160 [Brucella pseudogrignonensis]|uniref:hypothetical protein n=1 Tax=Brucella pseudogrignonensis TaxID=419475 RepID=UPI0038B4BC4E
MMEISVHRVTKIELVSKNDRNSNCRTVRIVSEDGEHELTLFGDTHWVDVLPRSDDFTDFTSWPLPKVAEEI